MKKEKIKHKFTKQELVNLILKLGGEKGPKIKLSSNEYAPLFPKFVRGLELVWIGKTEMYQLEVEELYSVFTYLLSKINLKD